MKQALSEPREVEFELSQLGTVALTLVVGGIIIAVGMVLLNGFKGTQQGPAVNVTASNAWIAINNTETGVKKLSDFLPIIGLAVAGVVVIGIVIRLFNN